LPKDAKQLLANYEDIPQGMLSAVVNSNNLRKEFIAEKILQKSSKMIGIYRLVMKKSSANFRESAILDIINILQKAGKEIIIYEPLLNTDQDMLKITDDLKYFKAASDIILANRIDEDLADVTDKVFSRDLYGEN